MRERETFRKTKKSLESQLLYVIDSKSDIRKEELALEWEKLELERERFEADRREREQRLDLESKERKAMIELLLKSKDK